MQIFLGDRWSDNQFRISGQEAIHCTRVLRKKVGDIIHAIDGKGNLYSGKLKEIKKEECFLEILDIKSENWENKPKIHIAISLLKQSQRFENFVEKSVETGVYSIRPIIAKRSERHKWRKDRVEKIAISACKQSQRAHFPIIYDLQKFADFVREPYDNKQKLICAVDEKQCYIEQTYQPQSDVVILVGPEGGFAKEELNLAKENGFIAVSLGDQTLRAETAGMMVCQTINTINRFTKIAESKKCQE